MKPRISQPGMTLIELLVAIAIAVLLIGVVYLIYATALNTLRTQSIAREDLEPAAEALDVLQRDLLCALAPRGATNPPFVFTPAGQDDPSAFSLRLFMTQPGQGSNDWRVYGIQEVEYALRANGATGGYALIRQGRPFRISPSAAKGSLAPSAQSPRSDVAASGTSVVGPPAETLVRSLAGIQIQLYDGNAWTNAWGADTAPGALPQAARISLQIELPSGPRTIATETLIPAGHKIKAITKIDQPADKPSSPKTNTPSLSTNRIRRASLPLVPTALPGRNQGLTQSVRPEKWPTDTFPSAIFYQPVIRFHSGQNHPLSTGADI